MSVDPSGLESQVSEDFSSQEEDEEDYYEGDDYYADDHSGLGEGEGDDAITDATFQRDPEHYSFTCLSGEEVWNFLDMQVKEMAKELKENAPIVRGLLHYLHWDDAETMRQYAENREEILIAAHLKPGKSDPREHMEKPPRNVCTVCMEPLQAANTLAVECGHEFCCNCWRVYLRESIMSGVASAIECMQCSVRVSLECVQALLSGDSCFSKYRSCCLAEFVQSHHLLRWCVGPNCSIVFQVKEPQAKKVSCPKCSTNFCHMCGEAYHFPADCECFRQWIAKCNDDSETFNYILVNTKDCPRCSTSIEKDGGCNHMHCSRCGYDFCWICMGKWESHYGYYNCSKYVEDNSKTEEKTRARESLKKYLFYYKRWATHNQSLALEEKGREKTVRYIEGKVTGGSGTWIDWQYLLDATNLLKKCRYTLKCTYIFAYYLEGDRKPLFEYQQAELENEIENLSWKVERAKTTDVATILQQMNKTEVKRLTLLRDVLPF